MAEDERRRLRFLRNWYASHGQDKTVDSISGRLVNFYTKYTEPLVSVILHIEAVQSGSGDPSPTNIRPITGFGGAHIYHSGADTSDYTTYNIVWPDAGTVYSGILDVNTGVLTVDKGVMDIGDYTWTYNSNWLRFTTVVPDMRSYGTRLTPYISSCYVGIDDGRSLSNVPLNSVYSGQANTHDIYIKENYYTDPDAFKAARTGQKIVYPLTTPLVYQLTPTVISSLSGTNNMWADTGVLDIEYVR